ncbi:MAG: 4-alpha-glucanotransferase, partial [Pseudomonadota bacterium]
RLKIGVWQFLPTGPTAYGDSPYQPLSSFAGNPMLIDTGWLLEHGFVREAEVAALRALPRDTVDYGSLIPAKNALLAAATERFSQQASAELKAERDGWFEANDAAWLHDYALYRILKTRHGERSWGEWEAPYGHRDPRCLRYIEALKARELDAIKTGQFLLHHQWQALRAYAAEHNVLLFGDMPIYIAFDSADAWANPEILQLDEQRRPVSVAGVPPDYFSEEGQLWGNPLYDWERHARGGYAWWIERLRHAMGMMDMVRIDHFRGFEAYWSVPADAPSAKAGRWVPGPADGLFKSINMTLGDIPIIAEDLGEITPEVDALRERYRIPGMHVLQFEASAPDFDAGAIGPHSVCYTGTHDNDTTVGWFNGGPGDTRTAADIEAMQRAVLAHTGGRADTVHLDLTRLAFSMRSRLAIVPMQDFLGLGSEARMNTPGKPGGNWRWRMLPEQMTAPIADAIAGLVAESGRG